MAYRAVVVKIERLTEFFACAVFTSIVIFMAFPLIYTIVHFNFLDAGKDSFFVFFPTWFVFAVEIE